ncbi:DUF3574 domain-containing protein [Streptomyces sp. NPDC008121]|uniref:DUF3574 domain-containing protein n=1 Tax=Streptomyces sp. NPDC008121 TaxID=3364809 RepID=UPI0036EE8B13
MTHRPFTTTRGRVAACVAGLLLVAAAPTAYATLDGTRGAAPAAATTATVTAPDAVTAGTPKSRGKPYVETRLFFGTERPDGGADVTDRQFMAFVDTEVTPAFPGGLTVQEGRGQWRDGNGTIERERSYELILLYPAAEATVRDPRIERIRDVYERRFAQESVARLDEPTLADF